MSFASWNWFELFESKNPSSFDAATISPNELSDVREKSFSTNFEASSREPVLANRENISSIPEIEKQMIIDIHQQMAFWRVKKNKKKGQVLQSQAHLYFNPFLRREKSLSIF